LSSADTNRRQREAIPGENPVGASGSDGSPSTDSAVPSVKRLGVAILAAFVTLLAADAALRLLDALAPTPHSYEVPRNPHFRRGWSDYTQPRERPDTTRLVIVISNSQGFLREHPDGALAYPTLLEAALLEDLRDANEGEDVIVANWSIAGGQSPEMIVLAARAAQHQPDAVVLVTSAGNFAPVWGSQPLSYWLSDATGLAYDADVRARLSDLFLERSSADDPLGWLTARTGIGRARRRFIEKRDEAWSWRREAPTRLGDVVERTLDQRGEGFTLGVGGTTTRSGRAAGVAGQTERDDGTASLLSEFVDTLHGTSSETRLLVVSMPIARPEQPSAAWRAAARFHGSAARALAGRPGVTVVDGVEVVPREHFVHATHLRPAGHRRFAEWLLPHLTRILVGRPETG
jgi:hypothetical protein